MKEFIITMELKQTTRNFLAFGVYGRDFNLDSGAFSSLQTSAFLITIVAVIATLKNLL